MCMEDIRVMRQSWSRQRTITLLAGAVGILVDRSAVRVALLISADFDCTLSFNQPAVFAEPGIRYIKTNGPLQLTIQQDGAVVMGTVYATSADDDPVNITVVETFLDKE